MRDIKVVSASRGSKTISSSAENWGQLKDSLRADYPDLEKMNAVVRETKTALILDESILPEGNFQLFLAPKQIKAGTLTRVEVLERLRDKLTDAINELIDEVEQEEDEVTSFPSSSRTRQQEDDERFLSKLSGL